MKIATAFITKEQNKYNKPIMVEVKRLNSFFDAEEYHQKNLDKHPSGYCHVNLNLLRKDEMK